MVKQRMLYTRMAIVVVAAPQYWIILARSAPRFRSKSAWRSVSSSFGKTVRTISASGPRCLGLGIVYPVGVSTAFIDPKLELISQPNFIKKIEMFTEQINEHPHYPMIEFVFSHHVTPPSSRIYDFSLPHAEFECGHARGRNP